MHEAAGMHLISTCTGNEVGSSYVLAFGSWITFVSCNALGVTLHIGIGDRTMDNGKQLIILVMMIIDYYQRLKDPYNYELGTFERFEFKLESVDTILNINCEFELYQKLASLWQ